MKTDTQVQQDVMAELNWEPAVNAARIGVSVKDGIVTLTGHVTSYAEKWDAERAAKRVPGVKALAIEMDVRLSGSNEQNDADIVAVKPKLSLSAVKSDGRAKARAAADVQRISADVRNAGVTLAGIIRNWTQRDVARTSA
jgi:osmotically-inducible protein OsmY